MKTLKFLIGTYRANVIKQKRWRNTYELYTDTWTPTYKLADHTERHIIAHPRSIILYTKKVTLLEFKN